MGTKRKLKGWNARLRRDLYGERGFGLVYRGGDLGSTYGEDGTDHFAEFRLVFLAWCWSLRFDWKARAAAQPKEVEGGGNAK